MTHNFISLIAIGSGLLMLPATAHAKDWYLGGSIGYNQTSNQTSTDGTRLVETEFDAGIVTTSIIGVKLENNIRLEGEFAWRRNDGQSLSFNGVDRNFTAKGAESYGLLLNAFYDFDTGSALTPYVGVGAGFDFVRNRFLYGAVDFEDNDVAFAWQVIGGVSTPLTEKIDGFIDARYHSSSPDFTRTSPADNGVSLSSEFDNFSVSVGYRYNFR